MKRLPHSARFGLCFAAIYTAALVAVITNYIFVIILGFCGISLDFLFDQFIWSLGCFFTGLCILGIILVAGDALISRPNLEVEEKLIKPMRPYMGTLYVGVTGIQWIMRILFLIFCVSHVVVLIKTILIWCSFFL